MAILAFQAGNNAGIGFATNALVGYDVRIWAGIFSLAAIGFLWLPDLYQKIELLVKLVVGVMLVAFVGTLAMVGIDVRLSAAGLGAFYLFTLGFFFASLSSLVVNAILGATLLVDGFGRDPSMDGRPVKLWATVAILFGLVVVSIFEGSPVELLRIAQAVAVIAFPIIGFLIPAIANDEAIMGAHTNGRLVNALGVVGYLAIVGIVFDFDYLREVIQLV